ncbi:hypothetical protein [Mycoplasma hafezii]|uniref:hypothetical protein n=1 Tax=Mycoplasma hafezii TaxID=525886 RepID=UPI003CEDBFEF
MWIYASLVFIGMSGIPLAVVWLTQMIILLVKGYDWKVAIFPIAGVFQKNKKRQKQKNNSEK